MIEKFDVLRKDLRSAKASSFERAGKGLRQKFQSKSHTADQNGCFNDIYSKLENKLSWMKNKVNG